MAPPGIQKRLVQLDETIRQVCAVAGTPGLSLVISRGGEMIHRRHFGVADVEAQTPVTANTLYPIGALTKALTVSAIALLVDDGWVAWTTPIKDVLPGFQSRSDDVAYELTVWKIVVATPRHPKAEGPDGSMTANMSESEVRTAAGHGIMSIDTSSNTYGEVPVVPF